MSMRADGAISTALEVPENMENRPADICTGCDQIGAALDTALARAQSAEDEIEFLTGQHAARVETLQANSLGAYHAMQSERDRAEAALAAVADLCPQEDDDVVRELEAKVEQLEGENAQLRAFQQAFYCGSWCQSTRCTQYRADTERTYARIEKVLGYAQRDDEALLAIARIVEGATRIWNKEPTVGELGLCEPEQLAEEDYR